ncbi:MAG: HNH endonuclease [Alistipes sp.]|nr:HNH endonuclease [Alistipes sp.]
MIRARLYKGLISKTMNMGSLIDDEKVKFKAGCHCVYCGTTEQLSIDHLISQIKGGVNSADNSVFACRRCNSSKGSTDLFEWYNKRQCFPPLLIIRRYLKIVYLYCEANNLLEQQLEDVDSNTLPFRLDLIPTEYPEPSKLRLQ